MAVRPEPLAQRAQPIEPARRGDHAAPLGDQRLGDGDAEARAGAGDQRDRAGRQDAVVGHAPLSPRPAAARRRRS